MGSVKTNLGHLEAASGMASVIKTALAMHHEELPGHLHLNDVHPDIGIERLPLAIPTASTPWQRGERPRYAGVSTFGFGGTNAHVILREAPLPSSAQGADGDRSVHLLALSARTEAGLAQLARRYLRVRNDTSVADLCFSANTGRTHFRARAAIVARDMHELRASLERLANVALAPSTTLTPKPTARPASNTGSRGPRIGVFFAPGEPTLNQASELYRTQPCFRQAFDHAACVLRLFLDHELATQVFRSDPVELGASYATAARGAFAYAYHALFTKLGVTPALVAGHGDGEYYAAAACGAMSWDDALILTMQRQQALDGVQADAIPLSLQRFKVALTRVDYQAPSVPFLSTALGRCFAAEEIPRHEHWQRHLQHRVSASDGLEALARENLDLVIVIGPNMHFDLDASAASTGARWLLACGAPTREYDAFLAVLAQIYELGVTLDFADSIATRDALSCRCRRIHFSVPAIGWTSRASKPRRESASCPLQPRARPRACTNRLGLRIRSWLA